MLSTLVVSNEKFLGEKPISISIKRPYNVGSLRIGLSICVLEAMSIPDTFPPTEPSPIIVQQDARNQDHTIAIGYHPFILFNYKMNVQ